MLFLGLTFVFELVSAFVVEVKYGRSFDILVFVLEIYEQLSLILCLSFCICICFCLRHWQLALCLFLSSILSLSLSLSSRLSLFLFVNMIVFDVRRKVT